MSDKESIANSSSGKYYVYGLYFPESMGGNCFYIGKGQGKRVYDHEKEARTGSCANRNKLVAIRSIWAKNEEVVRVVLAWFVDEKDALLYEAALVMLVGNLTNSMSARSGNSVSKLDKNLCARSIQWLPSTHASLPPIRKQKLGPRTLDSVAHQI